MARVSASAKAAREARLVVLKRVEDILDETFYQVREEFCNNADTDESLDWMDARIESALEKMRAEIAEQLAEITDEVLNADNAG